MSRIGDMDEARRQRTTPRSFRAKGWREISASAYYKLIDAWGTMHAELGFLSPGGAAAELSISRQAVHLAIDRGYLDAWRVMYCGELHSICVTPASVARYKASPQRRALKFARDQLRLSLEDS